MKYRLVFALSSRDRTEQRRTAILAPNMKILLLAPQPFYQERGTPIAVRLAAEVLAGRSDDSVTLMTYHEGADVSIPNVTHKRVIPYPRVSEIQPGFSLKKLYTDCFFFISLLAELWRNRSDQYQLIHAVEESVFMALFVKFVAGIPYIYDMDSSLSLQVVEKMPWCKYFHPLFQFFEKRAIKNSIAVVPVCDALAALAESGGSRKIMILRDISLLDYDQKEHEGRTEPMLRTEAGLSEDAKIILYVGNLEKYQGIDLLVESFAKIWKNAPDAHLVVIGGIEEHILKYQRRSETLGVPKDRSHFLGPRPVAHLAAYLQQADILTSPRVLGNNTPMKIYSYIHCGKPLLATNLPTHSQVLDNNVALLCEPTPEAFSKGLIRLLADEMLRERLAKAAYLLAEEKYTFEVFSRRLNELYDRVGYKVQAIAAHA
ncbi:MAG: glycosyltransferase family 4 protein [Bdellovibrionales bacterium]|nr:glycosyltransferase family 4 protein [Bdellovibrionales bacterium]